MKMSYPKRFRHACWISMQHHVYRYLMNNAEGRWDGALKAHNHIELCCFIIAAWTGEERDSVNTIHPLFHAVHEGTQELTGYLDEVIGFPLTGKPDYKYLAPKFFDVFYRMALEAMEGNK
jgi:hypothetical protein